MPRFAALSPNITTAEGWPMAKILSLLVAPLLLSGGAGAMEATKSEPEWGLWLAASLAGTSAFLWVGRMVWKAASERQRVLDKMCHQADRLDHLIPDITEKVQSVHDRISAHDKVLTRLSNEIARWHGNCRAREPMYSAMVEHMTKPGV